MNTLIRTFLLLVLTIGVAPVEPSAQQVGSLCSAPDIAPEIDYLAPSIPLEGTELIHPRRGPAGFLMMGGYENASARRAESIAQTLEDEGIKVVLSLHPLADEIYDELRSRGIIIMHEAYETDHRSFWSFHWYLGHDAPWHGPLLEQFDRFEPEEIAINCLHGVDRTGNASAFVLAMRFGVPIEDAWYAVVADAQSSVTGLANVLEEFGCDDRRERDDPGVSTYAYEQHDGMHVNTSGFRRYVRETITVALEMGAEFGDCVE